MIKLLTERGYNNGISRQVVYEWEDDISKYCSLSLVYMKSYKHYPIARLMRKLHCTRAINWTTAKDVYIFFAMNIDLLRIISWTIPNVIPVMLDVSSEEIDELYRITKKLPVFFVTSMKIKELLLYKYPDCKVCYIPQTVSDKHLKDHCNKENSIIQFGRKNPILHKYALRYVDTHENTSYIYRNDNEAGGMIIRKNGSSKKIGLVETREDFIDLLQKSSICLCSTPLMERTRNFGENVDFLTARWFEAISCRCFILSRESSVVEPELKYTGLSELINSITSYEIFEQICDKRLKEKILPKKIAGDFLEKNSASKRGKEIISIIRGMGENE